jgi:hypothetical protein
MQVHQVSVYGVHSRKLLKSLRLEQAAAAPGATAVGRTGRARSRAGAGGAGGSQQAGAAALSFRWAVAPEDPQLRQGLGGVLRFVDGAPTRKWLLGLSATNRNCHSGAHTHLKW